LPKPSEIKLPGIPETKEAEATTDAVYVFIGN
jgi:hypothetical protein